MWLSEGALIDLPGEPSALEAEGKEHPIPDGQHGFPLRVGPKGGASGLLRIGDRAPDNPGYPITAKMTVGQIPAAARAAQRSLVARRI